MTREDLRITEDMPEQEAIRREKLLKLEELGVNPFGERFDRLRHHQFHQF